MQARFVIAKHCLANDTEKVYTLLSKTYPDSFNAISIRDWPIFINFRETEQYKQFVEEHAEDFIVEEIPFENGQEKYVDDAIMGVPSEEGTTESEESSTLKGKWVVEEEQKT